MSVVVLPDFDGNLAAARFCLDRVGTDDVVVHVGGLVHPYADPEDNAAIIDTVTARGTH